MVRNIKNKIAFTVDVEDGISITMRDTYRINMLPTERVLINTRRILKLLKQKNIKGTFFILGIVAENYPQLIKEISENDHELGVHGYHHFEFTKINQRKAFEEISKAKKLIEDLSGKEVLGHRAPAFSINQNTPWALDVVKKAGFFYDSSIMPISSARYGWPSYKKDIHELENGLVEVPITFTKLVNLDIPVIGGRYFQIFPLWFSKYCINQVQKQRDVVFYMHPYEIDTSKYPDYYHNQLKKAPLNIKLRTYLKWAGRSTYYPKLDQILKDYEFDKMINIILNKLNDK